MVPYSILPTLKMIRPMGLTYKHTSSSAAAPPRCNLLVVLRYLGYTPSKEENKEKIEARKG